MKTSYDIIEKHSELTKDLKTEEDDLQIEIIIAQLQILKWVLNQQL